MKIICSICQGVIPCQQPIDERIRIGDAQAIITMAPCPTCSKTSDEVRAALEASVKLQSHYARQLNGWDGGERISFRDGDAWLKRLQELKRK